MGNEGVPLDWVMLEDGFPGTDDLVLTEKYQDGVIEAHLQIVVEDAQLDFISGDSLVQQFTLTAADGVDAFRGSVFRKTAAIDRWAWFDLDYLSVGPVSVPEPASLTLLAAGLGFLGVGRATRTRRRRGSQTV